MSELVSMLNTAQREAVTSTEGYVRVIAGAGTGKTRALAHRFAYLVNEIGIMPSNILCVTFTNKSANEMRQRIRRLTGDNDTGYISTFHGFCVSVLQEDSNAVSYPKSFLVLDNADIDQMLGIIYEERGLTLRDMTFGAARDMIEIRKCLTEPAYYEYMIDMSPEELRKKYDESVKPADAIFYGYLYQEKKCFGLDYNDLINYTLYIFRKNAELKLKWQKRLEYIMVDEFQDIDGLQYELMSVLSGHHKNLFIVGDPDQTIYTWRGANVKYLLNFNEDFPGTKTVMMLENYRSTPEILSAANSLISKNRARIKKELVPTLPCGERPVFYHAKTAADEAKWMADRMRALNAAGEEYSTMTVLYRAHFVSRTLEEVFLREEIPYTLYSGVQFFNRMEVKDALAYLRLVAYKDDLSFMRIANRPKRNIGEKRIKFLREYSENNACTMYEALVLTLEDELFTKTKARAFVDMVERLSSNCFDRPVSELLNALLDESGYEKALRTEGSQERLDNLAEFRQAVHEYEISCGEESVLESWLTHVAFLTTSDAATDKNAVKLMTVHTAKGLEFPNVFLCSMDEGVFPSKKTATIEGMEEERRLAFVAVTRAEKRLFITDSEGRNHDGSFRYPSRFVFDIEREYIDYEAELDESLMRDARLRVENMDKLLRVSSAGLPLSRGDRVKHPVLGYGTIEDIDEALCAYVVKFDELGTQRKISYRAKLEKLRD